MDGKKTGLAVAAVLLFLCGGGLISVGAGGYGLYTLQASKEQERYCLALRERARVMWLQTNEQLHATVAASEAVLAEHHAELERARLIRDAEATDRLEGQIMVEENRITSLNIALEAVDEMQSNVLTLPADTVVQQARIIGEMTGGPEVKELFTDPMLATMELQACVD